MAGLADATTPEAAALDILGNLFSVLVLVVAARLAGWRAQEYLGLCRPALRDVALGIGTKLALQCATSLVLLVIAVSSARAMTQGDSHILLERFASIALFWAASVFVGPIYEEVLFRGFAYRGLASSTLGPAGAILVTSLTFAVLHPHDPHDSFGTTWYTMCGALYGWLRWRCGSLAAPIAAHIFGNAIAATIATFRDLPGG